MIYWALLGTALVSMTVASTLTICLLGWLVWIIFRIRAMARRLYIMDIDDLLKTLEDKEEIPHQQSVALVDTAGNERRERLAAIVAGGLGERFLGRALSLRQVEELPASEVEKLYARYEIVLGASMTKDIGHSVIQMFSDLAARTRSQIDSNALAADLEANPLIAHELCAYAGSLYNKFGRLLTPIAGMLITFKHCRFGAIEHGDQSRDTGEAGDTGEKEEKPSES